MIETLFIQAKTKAGFEAKLSASEVKPDSIAFIEDTREIWTQGVYYPMSEIVTVSNLPGESLLSYNLEGTNYKYRIGDECRFYDTDKQEYRFYKLFDISDGRAKWGLVEGTTELATPSLDGLMSKEDKTKLDGLAQADWNAESGGAKILNKPDIYTKTEVDDLIEGVNIPGVYKYKGSKPTYQDLPTQSNEVGDVWNVVKTDINYAWTGTDWDPLGGTSSMASTTEAGLMSSENFTKLQGIEAGAQVNKVTSVAGRGGDVVLDKNDIGLNNVDNTSDANKPISTATQEALNKKVDASAISDMLTKTEANSTYATKIEAKDVLVSAEAPAGQEVLWIDTNETSSEVECVEEAPANGKLYSRKDKSWEEVVIPKSNYLAKDNTEEFIPTGDYNPATKKCVDNLQNNVLTKDNTETYTPTGDYQPATKKYIDDKQKILTQTQYDALGDKVLTDNILYLIIEE